MAQIIVTSTADDDGIGTTLREAIAEAEANGTGADTIVFDALLAGQTIHLDSALGALFIAQGTVSINGDTNGDGNPDIIISGDATNNGKTADDSGIFFIGYAATASLTSLQLSGGYGRGADGSGTSAFGAVYNAGTLSITDSIISGNYARGGNGYSPVTFYDNGGRGGDAAAGILNFGNLTVTETAFENNYSIGGDGGTGAAENSQSGNYDGGNGGNAGTIINSGTTITDNVGFIDSNSSFAGDGGTGGAQNTGYQGGTGGNGGYFAVGILNTGTLSGDAGYEAGTVAFGGAAAGGYGLGTPNGDFGNPGFGGITLLYLSGTVTEFTNLGSAPFNGVSSGNDSITASALGDLIISLTGDDIVNAGTGADTVYGGAGNDQLFGGIDNDMLFGGSGDDFINGQTEDDTVEGGLGNDTLEGGSNTAAGDTLSFANFIATSGSLGITVSLNDPFQQNTGAGLDTITGFENVTGSAFDDTITGSIGIDNDLKGEGGNDTLVIAGPGNNHDHFNGGDDTDTLLADFNWAQDVIFNMGLGAVTFLANTYDTFEQIENITVGGGAQVIGDVNNNIITVTQTHGSGTNVLSGGGGDDTIEGGAGADILNGDGNGLFGDTVSYSQSAAGVTVNLSIAVQAGGGDAAGDTISGFENVTGSAHGDTLTGSAGANVLLGGAGDDKLRGGAGADVINGGGGVRDVADYTGSNAAVVVSLVGTAAEAGGHAQGDTLIGIEDLTGSAHGDNLTGSTLANVLLGGAGDDKLRGWSGADVINGGSGVRDIADYTGSDAAVVVSLLVTGAQSGGHAQGDTLIGIEDLTGSAHGDTLTGSAFTNVLLGGAGDDKLRGGAGGDVLNGGAGVRDIADYTGSDAAVVVSLGGAATEIGGHAQGDTLIGIEDLTGSAHGDTLTGNSVANILIGGAGADTLTGGAGADTLSGGSGIDRLNGGTGDDALNGGGDADVFVYNIAALWNNDTITGWQNGLDKIDLLGAGFDFADFTETQDGSDTLLTLTANTAHNIRLVGINATTIDATDFI